MSSNKPSPKDIFAVEKMLREAQAGSDLAQLTSRLDKLTGHDFPDVAVLLALLAEHPILAGDNTLAGAISAIQRKFDRLWDDCEALAP